MELGQAHPSIANASGGGWNRCVLKREALTVEIRDSGLLGTSYGSAHLASRGWTRRVRDPR